LLIYFGKYVSVLLILIQNHIPRLKFIKEQKTEIEDAVNDEFLDRYPAEAVQMLEQMDLEEATVILNNRPVSIALKIWRRLSPDFGSKVLMKLDSQKQLQVIVNLEPNLGAAFLKAMDEATRIDIIGSIKERYIKNDLIRAMTYQEDTAGALMDAHVMYFRPDMTVDEVISVLRGRPHGIFRKIYTVDEDNRLHGSVDMEDLVLANRNDTLSVLERHNPGNVDANATREELVNYFEQQKVTDLPVLDIDKRLIGMLRYHVLVDAALEESSIDMQTMVGVSKDERALSPARFATLKRLPWLEINLATAFLAAMVVGMFEETIAQYTALAILLPVVAGQSGNTGAQSLAVTMRGLALKEIYPRMWSRIIFKEFNVGLMNGIAVAATTGVGVYLWSKSLGLTLVIMISMVLSMVIASVSGALIPIILTVTGQDPAQSSSIFLTTITDIAGFFSFLGIATLFLHLL
jgi:magnesium transporter